MNIIVIIVVVFCSSRNMWKRLRFLVTLVIWACCLDRAMSEVNCLGLDGKSVDWFIVYKMPRIKTVESHFKDGTGMIYLDNQEPEWKFVKQPITSKNHPIWYTLQQIYKMKNSSKPKERAYLMYNDRTPKNKVSSSKAHAKGSLLFDKTSGFWLIHSVPAFPSEDFYNYPDSGTIFGQTFICATFPSKVLNSIGTQLQFMNPQLYNYNASFGFTTLAPQLWELLKGKKSSRKKTSKIFYNVQDLNSTDGKMFVSFAKSRRFGKELYLDLVAPRLKNNLFVETWLNGNGDYPTNCSSPYTVTNVLSLNVLGMKFKDSQDHSKWAISDAPDQKTNDLPDNDIGGGRRKGKQADDDDDDDDDDDGDDDDEVDDDHANEINDGDDDDDDDLKMSEVLNSIKSLKLPKKYFDETKVVSKKVETETNWVCVGDINRQKSQTLRGGGTLCLKDARVWREFRKLIDTVEDCNGKEKDLGGRQNLP